MLWVTERSTSGYGRNLQAAPPTVKLTESRTGAFLAVYPYQRTKLARKAAILAVVLPNHSCRIEALVQVTLAYPESGLMRGHYRIDTLRRLTFV